MTKIHLLTATPTGILIVYRDRLWHFRVLVNTYPEQSHTSASLAKLSLVNEFLVIDLLTDPPDFSTNPYWKSEIGSFSLNYQKRVVGQFARKFLDKNFPDWKMPKHWDKGTKEIINLQSDLLGQTWKLIRLLPYDKNLRPFTLYAIALERRIFLFDLDYISIEPTATKTIRANQSINRALQSLTNPFCKESATWRFIDRCHEFASLSDDFRVDYLKLVSLRMTLVQKLKASGIRIMDQDGNINEKRGRKSIPPSRTRSG